MSIETQEDLAGIREISEIVGTVLKKMREYAQIGMSTYELDQYGGKLLSELGARAAPKLAYGFPGYACICVNHEIAHGIPSKNTILKNGDLVNVDVSAEKNGFWADNGGSFILGEDLHGHTKLVETSKQILQKALKNIKGGVRIADIGRLIETESKKSGFRVIKNLVGHGVGRSLHEEPKEIPNFFDRNLKARFRKNSVVAVETFISTKTSLALEKGDGWTYISKDGSYVAQHEHTIIITDAEPIILTASNGIW
jgi:methionyl aminopeptidase